MRWWRGKVVEEVEEEAGHNMKCILRPRQRPPAAVAAVAAVLMHRDGRCSGPIVRMEARSTVSQWRRALAVVAAVLLLVVVASRCVMAGAMCL